MNNQERAFIHGLILNVDDSPMKSGLVKALQIYHQGGMNRSKKKRAFISGLMLESPSFERVPMLVPKNHLAVELPVLVFENHRLLRATKQVSTLEVKPSQNLSKQFKRKSD
ncbi:hypothetical protein ABFS83_14G184000 [Erythranthe nasuta]